jgi:hypothetical protein
MSHIRLSNKFSALEVDQQNPGLLKHKDMKTKLLTGKSSSWGEKKRYCYLEVAMGRILVPYFKITWVLNVK